MNKIIAILILFLSASPAMAGLGVNPQTGKLDLLGSGGGGVGIGTVNAGTANQAAYYSSSGSTISGTNNLRFVGSNVGIGSATPGALLDVLGTARATTFVGALTGNASTATALQNARTINGTSFDGTGNITVTAAAGTLTGATLASGVTASSLTSFGSNPALGAATATTPAENDNDTSVATTAYVQTEISGLGGGSSGFTTDSSTKTTTTYNVGIGSVNPTAALDVNGTVKATAFSGSGSGSAAITGANVGIGTTATPTVLLHIGETAGTPTSVGANDVYIKNDLEVDGTVYMATCSGAGCGGTGGWTDGTNVVTLTTGTDNVGIGTGAPVYDLEIKKTVAGLVGTGCTNLSAAGYCQMEVANSAGTAIGLIATGSGYAVPSVYGILVSAGEKFSFGEKDGTINMVILGDGNVGIGTVNPVEKFQVNGTIRPTGYKSSDGTTGVTVTTCTGFKNGLCISGT